MASKRNAKSNKKKKKPWWKKFRFVWKKSFKGITWKSRW